ncbi:MAG: amidohydrolase [Dehalococcoidia bacterium]|nr:amidohydrolase [Dehalococcoidia bacterium]
MAKRADLILYNANVLTLDPKRPRAQMVAVKGERIIWVGENDDRKEFKGRKTQKIDCEGKTLVPGFNDAHCHVFAFASGLSSVDCSPFSPSPVVSIADIQAKIRGQAKKLPKGTWIRATGYNEFYLAERRHPNRYDLDEAAPHHPVKLVHRSRHACVLNSLALSLVGISMESTEPPGGMIDRDLDSGEPNGILFEMNSYIDGLVPPLSQEEFEKGIGLANEQYLSLGITSLQDATVHNRLKEWRTFQRLRGGALVPRLSVMMGIDAQGELKESGIPPRYGDDGIRLGALKIVLTEARGFLHPSEDELEERLLRVHRAGYQVAIHAVEESTVEAAVKALENALNQIPEGDHRHRIEHCSVCPPALLERLRGVHAIVVTQPSFIYYNGERYLKTVPQEQQRWLYRIGSFLKNGLMPAAGSDSPIVPINPLVGIYGAVTRKVESGEELLPQERISPIEALKMYTQAAAYASFDEGAKGSIAVDKLADFALLSADPCVVPPEGIKEIRVEMTIVDGRIVWQA